MFLRIANSIVNLDHVEEIRFEPRSPRGPVLTIRFPNSKYDLIVVGLAAPIEWASVCKQITEESNST